MSVLARAVAAGTALEVPAGPTASPDGPLELVALHALAWLAVASAVGLWMSTLLLVPALGVVGVPWTYGRWASLHLDLALYGWCGLPLVGLLCRLYLGPGWPGRLGRVAVHAWSGSLVAGAAAWLGGGQGGKPFVDWAGPARTLFVGSLVLLGAVLLAGLGQEVWARRAAGRLDRAAVMGVAGKAGLWLGLMAVPVVLWVASDPTVYPPINPATGGPTGASLLGSTLGVLWILVPMPLLLGLSCPRGRRVSAQTLGLLGLHTLGFLLVPHADRSHRELGQVLLLASLLPWGWLLPRHLSRFVWPCGSRRWLLAFLGWGAGLLGTGVLVFLPGLLDRVKFTDALVAHAHLAMAGMATSVAMLLLLALTRETTAGRALVAARGFVLWQGGCVVQVLALAAAGVLEAADPGLGFRGPAAVTVLYGARWVGGALMLVAALGWLRSVSREAAA